MPGLDGSAVAVASRNGLIQSLLFVTGVKLAGNSDGCQVVALITVRQSIHTRSEAVGAKSDTCMIECRATTNGQQSPLRIYRRDRELPVFEEVNVISSYAPEPRLRVKD